MGKRESENISIALSSGELKELREEILNTTEREEKKEAKLIYDGRQYSIRFPKKFIEEAQVNLETDSFLITLKIPEYASGEKPEIIAKLIRNSSHNQNQHDKTKTKL